MKQSVKLMFLPEHYHNVANSDTFNVSNGKNVYVKNIGNYQ